MNQIKIAATFIISCLVVVNWSGAQNCIYSSDSLYLQNEGCGISADLCLDVPFPDIGNYDIYVDGAVYTGTFDPCNFMDIGFYNFTDIGTSAPMTDFYLDSIIIGGTLYEFAFPDLASLFDSIIAIDPDGGWTFDPIDSTMTVEIEDVTYSSFFIQERVASRLIEVGKSNLRLPRGTEIDLTNGFHEIVLDEIMEPSCRDTLTVEVYCPSTTFIEDTLSVNLIDTICVVLDDLRGNIDSFFNACPSESGDAVIFDVLTSGSCVEIFSVDVGIDSACLVGIDQFGLVDTVFISIQSIDVLDSSDFIAINDTMFTNIDEAILFNPSANDILPGPIDSITIMALPANGTANLNPDGTILYTPNPGYTSNGIPDTIIYRVCYQGECRIASSFVFVSPPGIQVLQGFSPNGDGVNDLFVIENIEEYPNNELCIFNRWGNRVFQVTNYQNDWDGTWESSTVLPDGTYFYVLDVEIDSSTEQYTGYIHLRR